ncbi:MAG: LuxR C-terminal-related transcriptional regulator [Bacteroidota bacterium]
MRLLLFLLLFSAGLSAQYLFEGKAPEGYAGAYVYLDILDAWDDIKTISDQMPIQRVRIDSSGNFRIAGSGLPAGKGYYRLRFGRKEQPPVFMNFAVRHYVHFVAGPGDTLLFADLSMASSNQVNQTISRVSEQLDALALEERAAETERLPALINEKRIRLLTAELVTAAPAAGIFLAGSWPGDGPPLEVLTELEKQLSEEEDLRPTYLASLRASIGALDVGRLRNQTKQLQWVVGFSLLLNLILAAAWWRSRRNVASTPEKELSLPELTAKEAEVLTLIGQGHSNKEIGSTLFISTATVKTHINSIYRKAGITSRKEARALWLRLKSPVS